jgi:hypothetical protein
LKVTIFSLLYKRAFRKEKEVVTFLIRVKMIKLGWNLRIELRLYQSEATEWALAKEQASWTGLGFLDSHPLLLGFKGQKIMRRRKLSELFAEVDPQLKVIGGSYRYQSNKRATRLDDKPATEAYRYQPRTSSTNEDWERATIVCPVCRQPTARLLSYGFLGKRKACPRCIDRRATLLRYKARLFEARRQRSYQVGQTLPRVDRLIRR